MTNNDARRVVDQRNAGSRAYGSVLKKISQQGACPFCPKNFRYHRRPVLRHRGAWFITRNSWPYDNARYHFVIIGKEHKEMVGELTPRDATDILWLVQWAVREYRIPGGGFAMRFGKTSHTGATVCHIHAHLIVPKLGKNRRARTVEFPIG